VIGGEVTYRDALPLCERLYATEIDVELEGRRVSFPALGEGEWRLVEDAGRQVENELAFAFRDL